MPRRVIGSNNVDGNIYVLRSGSWSALDYPPPGGIGFGIWGGRGGAIWTHNGLGAGSEKFLHFDGDETWTQYDDPVGSASGPATIHGSDDGQYVYAGWRSGYVAKWDGVSWTQVASGFSARHTWCDPTGQHVYATDGAGFGATLVYYSSDYGVTWNDVYATITSDIGTYPGIVGCVWGISASEVYVTTRLGWPYTGYLLKYNGTSWSIDATNASYGMDSSGLWGNGTAIVAMGHNVSFDLRLAKKSGASMDTAILLDALYGDIAGWGKQIWGAGSTVVCNLLHESTGEEIIHLSDDAGSTWSLMSTAMPGYLGDVTSWYEPSGDVDFDRPTGGHYNLFLKIDGLEPILWQYSSKGEPGDFFRSVKTCLRASNEASAELDLATMKAGLSAMTFELEDIRDADDTSYFGKLFAPGKFASTPIAHIKKGPTPQQYVDADAVNIPISGDGANLSSGVAHLGQETIVIGAAAAEELTDCQRGMYPCVGTNFARTYFRPSSDESGYLMPVSENPYSWIGRRVALYATQWDDEEEEWVSDVRSELLWAGRISDRITQSGADRAWRISCTSILEDLSNKRIATGLATSSLAFGVNLKGARGRKFRLLSYAYETGALRTQDTIEVPAGVYSPTELIAELNRQLVSTEFVKAFRYSPKIEYTGNSKRAKWYLDAAWVPSHFVWFEYYDGFGFPCHVTQALGFNRGAERALLEKLSSDKRVELEGSHDILHSYQPLHKSYNGFYAKVRQARRFWADQGDDVDDVSSATSAAYSIPKCFLSATDERARSFYDTYTSRDEVSFTLSTSNRASLPQMTAQVAEDGFAGNSAFAKAPTEVKQVYIPRFKTSNSYKRYPFEMLLFPLLSTGTQGYNHSRYDRMPLGLAVGMQASLVDIPSFQNADLAIKNFDTAIRSSYVIEKPTTWMELVSRECRLFGYAVVWRKGKLTLRNVLAQSLDRAVVEIDESVGVQADEYPDMDLGIDTVVNQYNLKVGYDVGTRTYAYEFIITDAISVATLEIAKSVDLDHPGVAIPNGASASDILEPFFSDRWLAAPNPVVRVSLGHSMINKIHIGDVVALISTRIVDPAGSGTYETSMYATVIGLQWSFGSHVYSGAATLIVHSKAPYLKSKIILDDQRRFMLKAAAWAGSALLDQSAVGGGWNSVNKTLTLIPNHFGGEFDIEDGSRFEAGHVVIIVERAPEDPDSPQEWGPFAVAEEYETDGDNLLTLEAGATMAGFDADKEYTVEAADRGDVPYVQLTQGIWAAHNLTRLVAGGGEIAARWG